MQMLKVKDGLWTLESVLGPRLPVTVTTRDLSKHGQCTLSCAYSGHLKTAC